MKDFYKTEDYLINAIQWIRDNEPDNEVFAQVLYRAVGMSLEDVADVLAACGIRKDNREEIIEYLKSLRR